MTNIQGIITLNISDSIAPDLSVYDVDGSKVGSVKTINRDTGWFTVSGTVSEKVLHIPFGLITHIDPRELFVSQSKVELQTNFANPPARSSQVADVDGTTTVVTTELSGYDRTPIVVETARIDELKSHIVVGSHVYSSDMQDLGTIKTYDATTGIMTVAKGRFSKHDLLVPVTLVDDVSMRTHEVHLAFSQADLQRMQHPEPVNVIVVETEVKRGS